MTDFESIVVAIAEIHVKYPELRFTQVLQMLNINTTIPISPMPLIEDNFHKEDKEVLEGVKQVLIDLDKELKQK
tara:strand:+ start:1394 stop:1615 length:222 start_codon:yes stop_codon:yes gene_type:complete